MTSKPYLREHIFLIGDVDSQIHGNKLPTHVQVLKLLFYNLRVMKLSLRDSATIVIKEVRVIWEKACLPTKLPCHCIEKLEKLHTEWRNLQKNGGSDFNAKNEAIFAAKLTTLFDIAHKNVLQMVDDTRREFLFQQRQEEQAGCTSETAQARENVLHSQKQRIAERRMEKNKMEKQILDEIVELESSQETIQGGCPLSQKTISAHSNFSTEGLCEQNNPGPSAPKKSRGNKNIMTDKLVAVLDKCQVTDRNAVHLIAAVAESLQCNVDNLILNKTSIHRYREKVREEKAANIKKLFGDIELKAVVLHWDGKLLPDSLQREQVYRLPIVITNGDVEKLLSIPALENGKGSTQANAIHAVFQDWGLSQSIKALCCDTTNSNLGCRNGAAVLLEQSLDTDILYLPCRHHIFEVILASVFDAKMPNSNGPNVPLFKRFQKSWATLDQTNYKSGVENAELQLKLSDQIENVKIFIDVSLAGIQPRDDYKELLELSKIFIGAVSPADVKFRKPGAFHHARWMAKAIYCLKIYLFREIFKLTAREEKAISEICLFIVLVYIKAWFTAPLAARVPNHDLQFFKKLCDYRTIDSNLSQVTVKKFKNHLWYLNPETSALSFFDDELSVNIKSRMVTALNENVDQNIEYPKRLYLNPNDIQNLYDKELDYFINSQSLNFFDRFEIDKQFLKTDISTWSKNENYQKGLRIVKKLKVVNDAAERAVHLIEDYNNILTKNEEQKQYIIQLVTEYRKQFPNPNKETVRKQF